MEKYCSQIYSEDPSFAESGGEFRHIHGVTNM